MMASPDFPFSKLSSKGIFGKSDIRAFPTFGHLNFTNHNTPSKESRFPTTAHSKKKLTLKFFELKRAFKLIAYNLPEKMANLNHLSKQYFF